MRKTEIQTIKKRVAEEFNVTVREIMGSTKPDHIVFPRHVAMTIAYETNPVSSKDTGREFKRDHATVFHALKAVPDRCSVYPKIKERVNRLRVAFRLEPYA